MKATMYDAHKIVLSIFMVAKNLNKNPVKATIYGAHQIYYQFKCCMVAKNQQKKTKKPPFIMLTKFTIILSAFYKNFGSKKSHKIYYYFMCFNCVLWWPKT